MRPRQIVRWQPHHPVSRQSADVVLAHSTATARVWAVSLLVPLFRQAHHRHDDRLRGAPCGAWHLERRPGLLQNHTQLGALLVLQPRIRIDLNRVEEPRRSGCEDPHHPAQIADPETGIPQELHSKAARHQKRGWFGSRTGRHTVQPLIVAHPEKHAETAIAP